MSYRNYYEGKCVIVTGGAGAIGSRLVHKLVQLDAKVVVVDDLSSGYKWNLPPNAENLLFVEGDISNEIIIKRLFNENPDLIFHLAAFFANQNSVDYPERDLETNGFGTLKLLEYSAIYDDLDRFVYASSGCSIYGDSTDFPLEEDDISLKLSTPYQVTKMLGEVYGNYFKKQYDLPVAKARFFNSYGPGEVPGEYRNVIPNFIYWAMNEQALPITGDGEETRDFTYVGDIVDGLLRAGYFDEAIGESFNFCSGTETEIKHLAELVNDITGNPTDIEFKPKRKWDTKDRILGSYSKAERLIGYEPSVDFEDGLGNVYEWFEDNWEFIQEAADFGPGVSSAVRDNIAKSD